MPSPYQTPQCSPIPSADPHRPRRQFWTRVIWIASLGVALPPVIGFIGTVVGMQGAFSTLSETGEADPEALAGDISVALLTTVWGLIASALALILLVIAIVIRRRIPKPPTPSD